MSNLNNFSYNNYYTSNHNSKQTLNEYEASPDRTISSKSRQQNNDNYRQVHSSNKGNYSSNQNNKGYASNINLHLKNEYPTENTTHSPSNYGNKSIDNSIGIISRGEKIKKRWEVKKEKSLEKISFTPEITNKARNLSRDPAKFQDRLYPTHRINKQQSHHQGEKSPTSSNLQISNLLLKSPSSSMLQVNDTSTDDITSRVYFKPKDKSKENYDYQPKLDRNSLQMAKKLGDPKERLTRKKSRAKTPVSDVRTIIPPPKSPTNRANSKQHCIDLYQKAQYNLKVKNDLIKRKEKQEESSYLKYSYKPNILDKSKSRSRSKSADKMALHDRLYQWEKAKNNKKEKIKEQKLNNERENCTFKPNIEENRVCDDENFINKNLQHIMTYIARKQKVIEKKKEDEKLYKKKFGYGENYVIKKTVPKEFNLSTNHTKHVTTDDIITKNHQNYLQDFNKIRSKLKTEEFFDRANVQTTTENNNMFFEGENEGMDNPNNDYSNMDQDKLAMAVNYLHQQLHNE